MIKIIDKRLGEIGSGNVIKQHKTFSTYDPIGLPYSAQHWWTVIELDTGFIIAITDTDIKIINCKEMNG